jgi:DNA helicase-2/ATP-dependent DNA helicase PcrA
MLSGTGDRSGDVLDVLWLTERVEELLDFGVGVETGGNARSARLSADLQAELRECLNELSPDLDLVDDIEDRADAGTGFSHTPTEAKWSRFFKELLNITGKGLEHRYQACARAYMRLRGGVNADKVLRNTLRAWEPLCRKFDSAAEAERHARRMYSKDAVICSTIHAAKGLEWDYVFLIGVTQGVLPDRRAQTKEQLDEERRMLYTGITRAKVKLWLTHSPVKIYGVRQVYEQPSKFLDTDEVRAALKSSTRKLRA